MRDTVRAVAIVFNIMALLGIVVEIFSDSFSAGQEILVIVLFGASISALVALLWPATPR